MLAPTSQMRTVRELEPPSGDEGFAAVETIAFVRAPEAGPGRPGVFVARAALAREGWDQAVSGANVDGPHLLFDWSPGATVDALDRSVGTLAAAVSGPVHGALCPHPAGPPTCWCRPPLPGLPLEFARAHGVDPSRSSLIGTGPAHRTLARALGAQYVGV
jgi:hypothetical protein